MATSAQAEPVLSAVQGIEKSLNARVGFYLHDLQDDTVITHAADDRFPLNSTFKLFACAALLHHSVTGQISLASQTRLSDVNIVPYSPAVEKHLQAGQKALSFGTACQMMLSVSDNTAANVVLSALGGPSGLTAFLRSTGDQTTRLDRWETGLNEARPGDPRDTTTPRAAAQTLRRIMLGDILPQAPRSLLRRWVADHTVADALFRAALPADWHIHDRTGAGGYGSRSIIAVLYPPDRAAIITALYITQTDATLAERNTAIARVGAAIVARTPTN